MNRILFINSLQFDYLEDLVFAGLTELLGADNVVSCPVNHNYYFSKYDYPKNIGQCRHPLAYISDRLALRSRLRKFEFDAVVVGSTKEDAFRRYLELADAMPKGIPVVYIDGGDTPEVGGDAARTNFVPLFNEVSRKRRFDVIFKRECLAGRQYDACVIPLPFAFRSIDFQSKTGCKRYQVAFWAVESDPVRTKVLNLVKGKYDCNENGTTTGQVFRNYKRRGKFFLEELSSSKIAYNFKGVGWDTLRYWEVPGVATFMISGVPQIAIPNNFKDKEHAVFCRDDLSDLLKLTDYYLAHDSEREEIARNGAAHIERYHTHIKRAQYFLDICNEYFSRKNSNFPERVFL